jgi:Flp pilus assembly protein TadG
MSRRADERGQAVAEFAAVLPFFVLMAALLVQVSAVLLDQLAVMQAAREGARVAAVDPTSGSAAAAASRATGLDANRLRVTVGPSGDDMVQVRVGYQSKVVMPFTGHVLLRPQLEAEASMRIETP